VPEWPEAIQSCAGPRADRLIADPKETNGPYSRTRRSSEGSGGADAQEQLTLLPLWKKAALDLSAKNLVELGTTIDAW
jgi:hypothetical protein